MNDIKFNCPECGQHLAVDAAGAGATVACPKCGQTILVPQLARAAKPETMGRMKWWWLAALGGAVILLAAGLLVWQTHRRTAIQAGPAPVSPPVASKPGASADISMSANAGKRTASDTVSPPPAKKENNSTADERLKLVKTLYDQGLISKENYDQKVKEILSVIKVQVLDRQPPVRADVRKTSPLTPASEAPKTAQIWFAPFMYGQRAPAWQNGFGAFDYLDLFKEGAPWNKAASRVQVFKFYMSALNGLSDEQLNQVVRDLNRRGIAIGLEAPPLTSTDSYGKGIEGFNPHAVALSLGIARRIQVAGGTLRFIAMDEPFCFGSFNVPPRGAGLPAEEVARQVAGYIQTVKREFPDVIVGDIEPAAVSVKGVERFLEDYRDVAGEHLPFLHWDVQWQNPGWSERAKALETYTRARGIAFGMIYNGNMDATTDVIWLKQAEQHMAIYETLGGGHPDDVIFQSWAEHPHYLLPESDSSKFTWLINRYFDERTVLSVGFSSASPAHSREVAGKLTTSTGDPVGGARIEMSVRRIDGPAQFAEYTLQGVVPAGAKQAVFGFRVNTKENPSRGACDFTLYQVSYREGSEISQRIPNNDFSQGLKDWGLWSQYGRLQPSDRGSGQMLKVTTTAAQMAGLNSTPFTVTSGAAYTVTVQASVAPVSIGSGYFAIMFPGNSEDFRGYLQTLPVEAAVQTYTTMTDRDGSFRLRLTGFAPGRLVIEAKYAGDAKDWPCYFNIER